MNRRISAPVRIAAACALVLASGALTACNDDQPATAEGSTSATPTSEAPSVSTPAPADQVQRKLGWVTASSTIAGLEPLPIIKGTNFQFSLDGEMLTVKPGCHTHTGKATYRASDGAIVLVDKAMSSTREQCDEETESQDQRWLGFMMDSPKATMDGENLILTTDDGSQVAFVPGPVSAATPAS